MSFFPRERYLLKGDADWVGERGSSRYVEPEFDSAFCNRTGVRIDLSTQQISPHSLIQVHFSLENEAD